LPQTKTGGGHCHSAAEFHFDAANAFSDAVIVPLKKYTAPTGAWRGG
jgi:hypothetical protein